MRDRGDFFDLDDAWTPAAARWFACRIQRYLKVVWRDPIQVSEYCYLLEPGDAISWLVDWYVAHYDRFVEWAPYEDFRPDREANGVWRLREKRVDGALRGALHVYAQVHERREYPTLTAWLSALHRGELVSDGLPELSGDDVLGSGSAIADAAERRQRRWPRRCRTCGREFTLASGERRNFVRCRRCRRPSRTKRSTKPLGS